MPKVHISGQNYFGKRVWILEDDVDFLAVLHFLSQKQGYQACALSSLEQAWEILNLASLDPVKLAPNLVISDFDLGSGDSQSWMESVRKTFPKTRVLCFSGSLDTKTAGLLESKAIETLRKPGSLGELLAFFRDPRTRRPR